MILNFVLIVCIQIAADSKLKRFIELFYLIFKAF